MNYLKALTQVVVSEVMRSVLSRKDLQGEENGREMSRY